MDDLLLALILEGTLTALTFVALVWRTGRAVDAFNDKRLRAGAMRLAVHSSTALFLSFLFLGLFYLFVKLLDLYWPPFLWLPD